MYQPPSAKHSLKADRAAVLQEVRSLSKKIQGRLPNFRSSVFEEDVEQTIGHLVMQRQRRDAILLLASATELGLPVSDKTVMRCAAALRELDSPSLSTLFWSVVRRRTTV
ncbi:hypothetical protein [Cupriavidus numazuensis]|uniref:Uncharacterized protein n=1 Tax=Cupriavidus numazuensis TaxID=221992 RepID=A0ABM8TLS2_9BURK|nr:hypothetical protein [Cupriavidus numazuensis]CAG2153452.1 hypothetical protein LMG26411_04423 [Cupriavidus numazuensis]